MALVFASQPRLQRRHASTRGTPIKLEVVEGGVIVRVGGKPQLSLAQKRKAFNNRTGIVIGLPMTHAASNETNPFAVRYVGLKNEVAYVLTHQPKSFDWRERGARAHPWKQLMPLTFEEACSGVGFHYFALRLVMKPRPF